MGTDEEALLLPVFKKMQKWGVPLGLPEYMLAVQTLRSGLGLESEESFRRVCRLLWAKSQEDQEIFDLAFDEFVVPYLQRRATSTDEEHVDDEPELLPPDSDLSEDQQSRAEADVAAEQQEEVRAEVRTLPPLKPPVAPYPPRQEKTYTLLPWLPLTEREMAWHWRQLRRVQREGPNSELDIEGTISAICRYGLFRGPVWQSPRRNIATLLLLIDQRGSMMPFAPLINAFIESVKLGGLVARTHVYYFHDCPEDVIYEEATLVTPYSLQEVLTTYATASSVLVVSDAGAARSRFDSLRLEKTGKFIQLLSTHTYLYAWLNPVPPERWRVTTAEEIGLLIPMFYLDHEGLEDAINILRGHPFPPEVRMYA